MEKSKVNFPSIIFNVAEALVIFLVGILLKLKLEIILLIIVVYAILKMSLRKSIHYKSPYKCFIWSALMFLMLFEVAKAGIMISLIMTVFCAYVMTTKADLNDIFMWKGKSTKYDDIDNFIKYNSMDDKLLEFETKLKSRDNLSYLIYKYRFIDHLTFSEISERLDLDNPRIAEKIDNIAFAIRLHCGI